MEMEVASETETPVGADTRFGYSSQMELFSLQPRDLSKESVTLIEFAPIAQLRHGAPIEFNILSNSKLYIDLQGIKLYIKAKITKLDGTDISAAERVTVINYPIASIFQQVDMYMQQRLVCSSGSMYAFKSMMDILLESDRSDIVGPLREGLFFWDSAGSMDGTFLTSTTAKTAGETANNGFIERANITKSSTTFEIQGPLHLDLCRQERYLLNAVQLTLKFLQNREEFRMMRPDAAEGATATEYKLDILNAILKVPMVKPTDAMLLGHTEGLEHGPALYPFERTEIKSWSIPSGQTTWPMDNVFFSRLPKRMVIGLVRSDAVTGQYSLNPFNFQHFNLNHLCLVINGQCVPTKAIRPDYSSNLYMEAYDTLFSVSRDPEVGLPRKTTPITFTQFKSGFCLYCISLDGSTRGDDFLSPQTLGLSKIEVRFGESLSHGVTLLLYATFNSILRIDSARNVRVDG